MKVDPIRWIDKLAGIFCWPQFCRSMYKGAALLLWLAMPVVALAEAGSITVSAVDVVNQRPIDQITVRITSREGDVSSAESDGTDPVRFDDVAPGLYEVLVTHSRYQSARLPSVRVVANKNTPLQLSLALSEQVIEETIVVARAVSGRAGGSVGSSYIGREGLRSAAGSGSDVLRALDGLPGLFSDGEFASFTVRGNGPRDNLILVDGVPYATVVHFDDSFGEQEEVEGGGRYSVFAPNIISGAEFQPGGWNSAYGGGTGSLLKLDVAEGNAETPTYTLRLDLAGFEIGYDGPSGVHDDTSILFSARQMDFGRLFEIVGENDVGSPKLTDVILKTTTRLTDVDTLNVLAIHAPETFLRDVENALASDEDDPGNYEDLELVDTETDNSLFALSWSRLMGDNAELVNRFYYRNYDERNATGEVYPDLAPPDTPASEIPVRNDIVLSNRRETEIGWRSDFNVDNDFGRFSAGLRASRLDLEFDLMLDDDWVRYIYDQNDFRPDPQQRFIVLTPEAVNSVYSESGTSYSAYVDQSFEFDTWNMRAGLRYDYDSFSSESLVSPRFGANWIVSDRMRVSATVGRYYQAPRFNDRASDEGNRGLENEQTDQFSIGVKYLLRPDLEMFIEPYYQRLSNLVVELDGVNQTFANTGEGRSYGFDAALTRRFSNGWSANVNYSFNDARVKDAPDGPFYDADFSRPHTFGIGGVWEINDRWKLSARWKWASGAPRDEFIIHENVLGDGQPLRFAKEIIANNTDRFQGYNSLNFRADYRRSFGRTNLIAFIDIINVYGAENPSSAEFNERTGQDVIEEGESLPLLGFRLEW